MCTQVLPFVYSCAPRKAYLNCETKLGFPVCAFCVAGIHPTPLAGFHSIPIRLSNVYFNFKGSNAAKPDGQL